MKFHETHYEDYVNAVDVNNFHPELGAWLRRFPPTLHALPNLIFYGPTGVGKYSQVLAFLKRYSPSQLKYEKRMELETEKQTYHYRISDIHYEVDISLLGCNSKLLWHELFAQIVDIIANNLALSEKIGVIVCKNFHAIHAELLEIFYSYIQHYRNNIMSSIGVRFILITENISFLPMNILEASQIVSVGRPSFDAMHKMVKSNEHYSDYGDDGDDDGTCSGGIVFNLLTDIPRESITNLKELKVLQHIKSAEQLPAEIFDIICGQIIEEMEEPVTDYSALREKLYDILVYNLDALECIWCIFTHFASGSPPRLSASATADWMDALQVFLKQYNNNYRPIYHLESIILCLITKLQQPNRESHPPKQLK